MSDIAKKWRDYRVQMWKDQVLKNKNISKPLSAQASRAACIAAKPDQIPGPMWTQFMDYKLRQEVMVRE